MTVNYAELQGSPRESGDVSVGRSQFRATRVLVCNWEDRFELINELIGQDYPNFPATGGTDYIVPVALTYSIEPLDQNIEQMGSAEIAAYEKAKVTIEYGFNEYPAEDENGEAYSWSIESTAEFLTSDYTKMLWLDNPAGGPPDFNVPANPLMFSENEAFGVLYPGLILTLTRYNQTSITPAHILGGGVAPNFNYVGTVNAGVMTCKGLGLSFDAGTLLYGCPTLSQTVTLSGAQGWTIQYRFTYKPNGWNKFWRLGKGEWQNAYKLKPGDSTKCNLTTLYNPVTWVGVFPA